MTHQANQTKVATIEATSIKERDTKINEWMKKQSDKVRVIDMQYVIIPEAQEYYCSVIYTTEEQE